MDVGSRNSPSLDDELGVSTEVFALGLRLSLSSSARTENLPGRRKHLRRRSDELECHDRRRATNMLHKGSVWRTAPTQRSCAFERRF